MKTTNMISVTEAKQLIKQHSVELPPVSLPLKGAVGKLLAGDIYATVDIPAFPQSSMDGYAFSYNDLKDNKISLADGEIAAGNPGHVSLPAGKAIRIFTGAPVPAGADTVVMQEKVSIDRSEVPGKIVIIEDGALQQGMNVRPKGSEIKKGEPALEKGSLLSPAALGFLAGIGVTEVTAYPNPSVSIIITGRELQTPGKELGHGQVYESNSFTLTAALEQLHVNEVQLFRADDDLDLLTTTLGEALRQADLVLLTGGISAGDYDFVLQAAENCGVQKLFHKIKQRPGKPLYFGKKENKLVFGLPGNPSSVLTCFYEYVLPALAILTKRSLGLRAIQAPLSKPFTKKGLLTCFLKGSCDGRSVTILEAQESYRMQSFARANCLVQIGEEEMDCKAGDLMEVHLLPS